MTNIATIRAHLDSPLYDAVKIESRRSFVAWVGERLAHWSKEVLAYVPDPKDPWQRKFPGAGYPGLFFIKPASVEAVKTAHPTRGPREDHVVNAVVIAAVNAGEYAVNVARAEKQADDNWQADKAFYAHRVGTKLDELLQDDALITCDLERSVHLIGTVTAHVDGKALRLRTSLKTNYRYGENAADGKLTIYRQVPTIIESAKGFDVAARERQIRYEATAAKTERAAKCEAAAKELQILERRKSNWDDLYSTLRYVAKYTGGLPQNGNLSYAQERWAKLGGEGKPLPTLNEAKLQYLDLRAQVKAAKLALKAARAVKA